jgi:hypothetical protein
LSVVGRVGAVAVSVEPGPDEPVRLDLEPRLLAELPAETVERRLGLFEEAAGQVPCVPIRIAGPANEQQPPVVVDDERAGGGLGVRVRDESARRTIDPFVRVLELRGAARAVLPAVDPAHGGTIRG